ncbi:alpha-ribazole phosphatase [Nitrosococcus watsonii]|uniref:Alpha-ribazole phosphatase n=1 Tax=Nitrosococcus watsoni (strain C-113) TaxID=105559 RepID=D8K6S0_NITWC|nr:alpha-ribazole phosphatase [Nitrosococcus watsonii]ADJ28597.1 alpha-ribazole phosphatase [Nitrosococcus watsonii C-113]
MSTLIDLIRHGEPVGGHRYRGHRDDPLSEKGWSQMRAAVGEGCPWDRIISSPLKRCAEFAYELSQRHGRPLQLDERLQEISFGAWEGSTAAEVREREPEAFRRFYEDPVRHTPPGAESFLDFRDRVIAAWEELLNRHGGEHVLVVAHAGTMRMLIRQVLEMPLETVFRIHVPNAGISRIQVGGEGPRERLQLLFHGANLPI